MNEQVTEYVTASKAAELMKVSRVKISRMLDRGELSFERDPYDGRVKLIPLAEVHRYMREHAQIRRVTDPKALALAS